MRAISAQDPAMSEHLEVRVAVPGAEDIVIRLYESPEHGTVYYGTLYGMDVWGSATYERSSRPPLPSPLRLVRSG